MMAHALAWHGMQYEHGNLEWYNLLMLQERLLAERRIQHLESSCSSTRQELNAARLAGIAERQKDDRQISSLKAQVPL